MAKRLIDYLSDTSLNLRMLKKFFDNPKEWFKVSDILTGCMWYKYKNVFDELSTIRILAKKEDEWVSGRGLKRKCLKFKLNSKNKFVKILNSEVKNGR